MIMGLQEVIYLAGYGFVGSPCHCEWAGPGRPLSQRPFRVIHAGSRPCCRRAGPHGGARVSREYSRPGPTRPGDTVPPDPGRVRRRPGPYCSYSAAHVKTQDDEIRDGNPVPAGPRISRDMNPRVGDRDSRRGRSERL